MRNDTLVRTLQIAERLRGGRRTLDSLATEFNVNRRTVRRAIEALELAGAMVRHDERGGPWWIERERATA